VRSFDSLGRKFVWRHRAAALRTRRSLTSRWDRIFPSFRTPCSRYWARWGRRSPCPSRGHPRRPVPPTVGTLRDGPDRAFSPFYATFNRTFNQGFLPLYPLLFIPYYGNGFVLMNLAFMCPCWNIFSHCLTRHNLSVLLWWFAVPPPRK